MAKKKSNKQPHTASPSSKTSAITLFSMLSLRSVRLVEAHSKLNILNGVTPSDATVKVGAQLAASVDRNTAIGSVTANVATIIPEGHSASDVSTLSLDVIFQCVFESSTPLPEHRDVTITPDEMNTINVTLTYITWPYIRAHVQLMTSSMGIPPITLGLFKTQETNQPATSHP